MRRFLSVLASTCVLFTLGLFPIPTGGEGPSPDMQVGFYFWHQKGSLVNTSEYDPKFPNRYEYLKLDGWSPNGWAPRKIDAVLEFNHAGETELRRVSTLRVTVSLRIGPLRTDPRTKLTDFKALEDNAIWLPARLIDRVQRVTLPENNQLVLLKDFDLEAIYTDLWERSLWPLELRVEVLLEPVLPDRLDKAIVSRTLRIIPGD